MGLVRVTALLLCFCSITLVAKAETCTITEKQYCEQGHGCKAIPITVYNRLDLQRSVYSRCDALHCDDYPAQFTKSGAYTVIDVPDRGLIAKLSATSEFTEVATSVGTVYVSFGTCH